MNEELVRKKTFEVFTVGGPPLHESCIGLLASQREEWPMCKEGYASLGSAQTRTLRCDGFDITLQFNPQRIVSSGAKVDPKSIAERKCFLCLENLPEEQQGIAYRDDGNTYLILCNPMPIFRAHYTITHIEHRPQELVPFLPSFLRLARDLSPKFSIFYNGPKCGASAPDHMHFQACPTGAIPIEAEALKPERRKRIRFACGSDLYVLTGMGRSVVVLESGAEDELVCAITDVMKRLSELHPETGEPLVNVIARFIEDRWVIIIFPRAKHRPDVFFRTDDARILISPAAVDMGGLVVTPLEIDFKRTECAIITDIFNEVTIDPSLIESII